MPNWIVARSRPRRSQAGAGHARQGETSDPDCGLGRLLVRRVGRVRAVRRAARRAGAHHDQMQGHDPGGSPVARRLHHRRADRAQAGDGIRSDRHGRSRRGGTAAQAVALHAAGAVAVFGAQHRRVGAGRSGDHRRSQAAAGRPRAQWAPEGTNWGEKAAKNFRTGGARRPQHAEQGPVAAAHHGSGARHSAAQHDCDLRCRRQPPAGRAEVGVLRAARIPHLERPRFHGLRGARRAWPRAWLFRTGRWSPSPATAAS